MNVIGRRPPSVLESMNALRRIVRWLRVSAREAESSLGISGAQLFVLQQLGEHSAQSLVELAQRTSTDPSSVSVVVQRLTERKLVRRSASVLDRRRAELSLTDKGRAMLRRTPAAAPQHLISALRGLRASDLRALTRGLVALVRAVGLDGESPPLFFEEDARRNDGLGAHG
jgi:MarR family transcriptional regulator, lower aerobic nicotinate degradation pathway regulator